MKTIFEKLKNTHFNSLLMGDYLKRYNLLYLLLVCVVALFEVVMIIRGIFTFDFSYYRHVLYFVSYFILFAASLVVIVCLIIERRTHKYSRRYLTNLLYFYATVIIIWATLVSNMDLLGHHFPIVYMTIVCILGGVVVINPIYYISMTSICSLYLLVFNVYFNSENNILNAGDYINVAVFLVMSFIVTYRNYRISNEECHQRLYLERLSYQDTMTGLLNKNSYFKEVDKIDELIKNDSVSFAIVEMDLNGLKSANDKYGHRYGSQLIVEAGHRIKGIFKNALVYHVSGDEFIALIYDNIFDLDTLIAKFDRELAYQEFEFDGQKMILSIARGYAIYNHNEKYNDTFQRADKSMYENKIAVKKKYGLGER